MQLGQIALNASFGHGSLWWGLFLMASLACICAALPAFADEELSDATKRQKVEAMYAHYKESFPEVADLSADRALELMAKGRVVFVDVRKPKEQAVSMLPGAITDKMFLENPAAYKDYLMIGYCTISYRSGKLAQRLQKKGIQMLNLRGGILAWLHAGGKVYKDAKLVNRVHVYGKKWDLAPSAYESVL